MPSMLIPYEFESRSRRGDVATTLTFVNDGDEPGEIYWIDYDGQPRHYRTLAATETWRVSTWATHAWVVVGANSGQFLARAIASEAPHTVRVSKIERTRVDRPDEQNGFQIQPLYVLPADGTDHYLDVNGTLATSITAWNNWFAEQTDGFRLRIDTYNGHPDIVFVRLTSTAAEIRENTHCIHQELQSLGLNQPNKIYAVYYDGPNAICGDGSMMKAIGTVYLEGELCPGNLFTSDENHPGYWEFVMLHELLHALGCVPDCAPNASHDRPGHVDDHPQDIMYYRSATHPLILDAGRDDYYGHGRRGCFDLARSPFLDPLPDEIDLPVTWQLHQIRTQLSALSSQVTVTTTAAGAEMRLTVVNQSEDDLFLFFVNERSEASYYAHLAPGAAHDQHTFANHAWVLAKLDVNQRPSLVRQFVAAPNVHQITV
ncbi:MAG: hypothetical protein AAFU54_28945 [Chloroflexota bacterium]